MVFKKKQKSIFNKKKKFTKIFLEVGFQQNPINIRLKRFHGQFDIQLIDNMSKSLLLDNSKTF